MWQRHKMLSSSSVYRGFFSVLPSGMTRVGWDILLERESLSWHSLSFFCSPLRPAIPAYPSGPQCFSAASKGLEEWALCQEPQLVGGVDKIAGGLSVFKAV